ncbi:hypothetical protein HG531_007807 [Fusarium graminearum]|nr:hypothetical protein HG531_007807 [Fusarium graminearum]
MIDLLLSYTLSSLSSPRTSSRCADDDAIPSLHRSCVLGSHVNMSLLVLYLARIILGVKLFQGCLPVCLFNLSDPEIEATFSVASAIQAIRTIDTALAEDGDLKRNEKLNVADDTVTAAVLTLPS